MQPTKTLLKIAALKKRIKGIQGGQGAGKTYAILTLLVNHALKQPNREVIISSAELTKMRLTVIKDFVNCMKLYNVYEDNRFIAGTLYRFANGSFIKFIGLDQADIGKGLRCDVLFINEANKVGIETARQIISRAKQVFIDFNPDERFWFHSDYIGREDVDTITVTYKDNHYLSAQEIFEIEQYRIKGFAPDGTIINKYWANKWTVYGEGKVGALDGLVFQNFDTFDIFPDVQYTRLFGIDWGGVDPYTLIECRISGQDVWIYEHLYKSNVTIEQLTAICAKHVTKKDLIIADSARNDRILEMQLAGFNCIGANKGGGSIIDGIETMQNYNLHIHKSAEKTLYEFNNYVYAKDNRTGLTLPVPIDKYNHSIDNVRYQIRAHHLYGFGS